MSKCLRGPASMPAGARPHAWRDQGAGGVRTAGYVILVNAL
ncbi:hypothetical protein [Streptomyces sp. 8ZJF_21]|nr:hypothetical protein [Streptomyces sp. 8ZJF_21]